MADQTSITDLAVAQVQARDSFASALVQTDDAGRTVLAIPEGLNKKANVLAPSAVLTQEQPFFKPGFTVVNLSADPVDGDFYELQGALAPTKQALQKLGDAAGISFDPDKSYGKEGAAEVIELPTGRKVKVTNYTYHAVGYIRMPDGTLKALTADEEWQPNIALAECELSGKSPAAWKVEKEFLFQAKKRAQIIRSKAMNGVLRQANPGLKQKYTATEAAKPFLVVSWSWSPDMEDENTGRIVASLVGADTASLYGPAVAALPVPAPKPWVEEPEAIEAEGEWEDADGDKQDEEIPSFVPMPVPEEEHASTFSPEKAERLRELGLYVLGYSNYKEHSLLYVWQDDPEWFTALMAWSQGQSRMAPGVLADVEAATEFLALVKQNGGEAL